MLPDCQLTPLSATAPMHSRLPRQGEASDGCFLNTGACEYRLLPKMMTAKFVNMLFNNRFITFVSFSVEVSCPVFVIFVLLIAHSALKRVIVHNVKPEQVIGIVIACIRIVGQGTVVDIFQPSPYIVSVIDRL